jgi:hypothetical protein
VTIFWVWPAGRAVGQWPEERPPVGQAAPYAGLAHRPRRPRLQELDVGGKLVQPPARDGRAGLPRVPEGALGLGAALRERGRGQPPVTGRLGRESVSDDVLVGHVRRQDRTLEPVRAVGDSCRQPAGRGDGVRFTTVHCGHREVPVPAGATRGTQLTVCAPPVSAGPLARDHKVMQRGGVAVTGAGKGRAGRGRSQAGSVDGLVRCEIPVRLERVSQRGEIDPEFVGAMVEAYPAQHRKKPQTACGCSMKGRAGSVDGSVTSTSPAAVRIIECATNRCVTPLKSSCRQPRTVRLRLERYPTVDVVVAFAARRLPAGQPVKRVTSRHRGDVWGARSSSFDAGRPEAPASVVTGRTVRAMRFGRGRRSGQPE